MDFIKKSKYLRLFSIIYFLLYYFNGVKETLASFSYFFVGTAMVLGKQIRVFTLTKNVGYAIIRI